jgi:hypothetical protein
MKALMLDARASLGNPVEMAALTGFDNSAMGIEPPLSFLKWSIHDIEEPVQPITFEHNRCTIATHQIKFA